MLCNGWFVPWRLTTWWPPCFHGCLWTLASVSLFHDLPIPISQPYAADFLWIISPLSLYGTPKAPSSA